MAQVQKQVILVYDDAYMHEICNNCAMRFENREKQKKPYKVKRTIQVLNPKVGDRLSENEVKDLMQHRAGGNTVKVVTEGK